MKYIIYFLVFISLLFLLSKLSKRFFIQKSKVSNVISFFLALLLTPVVCKLILILFMNVLFYEFEYSKSFDSSSWISNPSKRYMMRKDIIEDDIFLNLTQSEIEKHIGAPGKISQAHADSSMILHYNLGNRRWGFGLKFFYMDIRIRDSLSSEVMIRESID